MNRPRHAIWGPFEVRVTQARLDMHRGWEDCPLPNGEEGWCVYLEDRNKHGTANRDLSDEAIVEIRQWLAEALGMNNETIDDSVYLWGVTFEHQSDALLCFMRFR